MCMYVYTTSSIICADPMYNLAAIHVHCMIIANCTNANNSDLMA